MLSDRGYGWVTIGKIKKMVQRFAYEFSVGVIPEGMELDHLCMNRACCNPSHLQLTTRKQNTLRGNTIAGNNSRKTHCPAGHPYSPENTIVSARVGRLCRICQREHQRNYRLRRRMAS